MNNSVTFSAFTILCSHHLCLVSITPNRRPLSSYPAASTLLYPSTDLPILDISYKQSHAMCGVLCRTSLPEPHPGCGRCQCPWMDGPQSACPLVSGGHIWAVSTFPLLGTELLRTCVYKYLSPCFQFFGFISQSGIAGPSW